MALLIASGERVSRHHKRKLPWKRWNRASRARASSCGRSRNGGLRDHAAARLRGEYKGQYALALGNPPLAHRLGHAPVPNPDELDELREQDDEFGLDDLADAAVRDKLKSAMSDPERLQRERLGLGFRPASQLRPRESQRERKVVQGRMIPPVAVASPLALDGRRAL